MYSKEARIAKQISILLCLLLYYSKAQMQSELKCMSRQRRCGEHKQWNIFQHNQLKSFISGTMHRTGDIN